MEALVSVISTRFARLTLLLAGTVVLLAADGLHTAVPVVTATAPAAATHFPDQIYLPAITAGYPPLPTATPSQLPTKPPAGSNVLAFVNYYRSTARLPGVTDEPAWSSGD